MKVTSIDFPGSVLKITDGGTVITLTLPERVGKTVSTEVERKLGRKPSMPLTSHIGIDSVEYIRCGDADGPWPDAHPGTKGR